jgi:4-amino-4-deoxy-L-arabinose transferase-like glycosyltransferase
MRPSWHAPTLVSILAVALALRIAGGLWWQSRLPPGDKFGMPDSETYWALGRTIAEGKPYQLNPERQVFRTPGYPLLLAPLFRWFGPAPPVGWAYLESAILSTLAVGAVYWLTRCLFDRRIGLVAAGIAAIYPGAISEGSLVLSEAPFVPLMLVSLTLWGLAWQSSMRRRRIYLGLAAGFVSGAATLMRPSWLLFVPFAMLLGLLAGPERLKHLTTGLAISAGLVAAMAPWWIRNWGVKMRFIPTTLQVGPSLYDGLNPDADGSSNMEFMRNDLIGIPRSLPPWFNMEDAVDLAYRREAILWAGTHPWRVVQLAAIKFRRLWSPWPNEPSLRSMPIRIMVAATYLPLLILSLWGVWRYRRRGWSYTLCWLPAIYFTLLHTVFVASIRYREPAMVAMIPLAVATLVERVLPNCRSWFRRGSPAGAITVGTH